MAFSENDIRPEAMEAGRCAAMHADLDRLAACKHAFVSVACPACDTSGGTFAFEKYGFNFDRCPQCGTIYMNPRATPEILADFYARSALYEFWDRYIFPASREMRTARIFRPRVERIKVICAERGITPSVLVEVGAAGGMFCEEAVASGAFGKVIGIEPGAAQAATCRSLGLEVIEAPVEAVDELETPADIVASFETIEHLFAPKDFLVRCRKLLAPGGLLVLTCPNYHGFDIMTLGPLSESLDAEHINMFNLRSLGQLVERIGFEVIELTTPGQLDAELVRNKILEGSFSVADQPFLRQVLVDDWDNLGAAFQNFLKANRLSSHMWLVARARP